ncbi:MAG TPA: bifunctional DNA-binding transcriptional regulator/O6-methylguanine-DNA methyltransferase Ada [Gemmatimonadaceae bacterium]|nr:bifunctional DNA-binding transcriptional regulator/O6-methylguanine-DNA methyltransferase Ada [Gemmatimonadaceae bacterium]
MSAARIDESKAWDYVLSRDETGIPSLVYAVATTGIYCRPSCPSRRPRRHNVTFFSSADAAEQSGYRACLRCRPNEKGKKIDDAVERARNYIDSRLVELSDDRITLDVLSAKTGMSPFHLQRKFKAALGLSPAEYIRAKKSERLKSELRRGETVSRATYGAGYGSSSRVYDGASTQLGMTPATYRRGGSGLQIEYVIAKTSLGALLVAATERGVCAVTLGDDPAGLEKTLAREFPAAERVRALAPSSSLGVWIADIVASLDGERTQSEIPLDVQASAFQWKVWRALQQIPFGETRSYSEIAKAIGSPRAARAVASACANNRVAVIIPCHRVVRSGGALGGYRWGLERKQSLLDKERSARERGTS